MDDTPKRAVTAGDAFSSVAFWEFMAFFLLLLFIWVSEILDLPALLFGAPESEFSFYRAMLLSAAVITLGIVAVGHTYERQKAVIKRLLMTCTYCHKVLGADGQWEYVEEYFTRHYPMDLDKGSCPACEDMLKSLNERQAKA